MDDDPPSAADTSLTSGPEHGPGVSLAMELTSDGNAKATAVAGSTGGYGGAGGYAGAGGYGGVGGYGGAGAAATATGGAGGAESGGRGGRADADAVNFGTGGDGGAGSGGGDAGSGGHGGAGGGGSLGIGGTGGYGGAGGYGGTGGYAGAGGYGGTGGYAGAGGYGGTGAAATATGGVGGARGGADGGDARASSVNRGTGGSGGAAGPGGRGGSGGAGGSGGGGGSGGIGGIGDAGGSGSTASSPGGTLASDRGGNRSTGGDGVTGHRKPEGAMSTMSSITNHLLHDLAPITPRAWQVIESEARNRLAPLLAARQVVDFVGPGGWEQDAVATGNVSNPLKYVKPSVNADPAVCQLREVQSLVEVRIPFTLSVKQIEEIDRGKTDIDFDHTSKETLDPNTSKKTPDPNTLGAAVNRAADIENWAVFNGWKDATIVPGIVDATTVVVTIDDYDHLTDIIEAVTKLRASDVAGPYTLAINNTGYKKIIEAPKGGGYLLSEYLIRILGGKIVLMTCLDDHPEKVVGIVVSERGGDFVLHVGQDLSIGYNPTPPSPQTPLTIPDVHLYVEESFTFRVARPGAAVKIISKT